MTGIIVYALGEGKHNEHYDQRLISGSDFVVAKWGVRCHDLGRDDAIAMAKWLDRPRRHHEKTVKDGHVWHCSLNIKHTDRQIDDGEWAEIAREFLVEMGFEHDVVDEDSVLGLRWAAFHHGASLAGNDHIHIVVNLVHDDGRVANVHCDYARAQAAARVIELRHGLESVEGREMGRSLKGYSQAERAKVEAQAWVSARSRYENGLGNSSLGGMVNVKWDALSREHQYQLLSEELKVWIPRYRLAGVVRQCAVSSQSELEFVHRIREQGVWVRPRFAKGGMSSVEGYSVALPPVPGEKPVFFSGIRLGNDLTLPRLRQGWGERDSQQELTVAAWTVAGAGKRITGVVDETVVETAWDLEERLIEVIDALRFVDPHDVDAWAVVARQCSGVLWSMSRATEPEPGPLAHAAHAVGISAQTLKEPQSQPRVNLTGLISAARVGLLIAAKGEGIGSYMLVLQSMMALTRAVAKAAAARREFEQAKRLELVWKSDLEYAYSTMNTRSQYRQYVSPFAKPVTAIGAEWAARQRTGQPAPSAPQLSKPPAQNPQQRRELKR
jgi:hypothetical protein